MYRKVLLSLSSIMALLFFSYANADGADLFTKKDRVELLDSPREGSKVKVKNIMRGSYLSPVWLIGEEWTLVTLVKLPEGRCVGGGWVRMSDVYQR